MGPGGDDGPAIEQSHAVGKRKRGGPVHHEQRGHAFENRGERRFDHRLCVNVDRGERVVENEHLWSPQHRPRQGEPLPLAARQRVPLLANSCLEAPRQIPHEARLRDLEGALELLI